MATKYIECEKALDAISEWLMKALHTENMSSYNEGERAAYRTALSEIEELPAADVQPVVRVKWIEDWETGCSECPACHDTFLWEDYKGVAEWNFCPNCGADMRKKS